MKKSLLVTTALVLMSTAPAHAHTHDTDFPKQMAAINQCYVEYLTSGKPTPAPRDALPRCMEGKGFKFCDDCQIFRYSGGPCKNDKENGPDRATCWRIKEEKDVVPNTQCKVADPTGTPLNVRTQPTAKSMVVSRFENELTVGVYEWQGQWAFVESWGDMQPGMGWVYAPYLTQCRPAPPPQE